jgi:multicomponent Na+:H+ antiporter subunit G
VIKEVIVFSLCFFSAFLTLLAAIGVIRMPDFMCRMQTSSKAATLGSICAVLAVAIYFFEGDVAVRALLISVFFSVTAPIAAHVIARAGYISKVPLSDENEVDELAGKYHPQTHRLKS